jgi:tetratricopeptide (TPR) repeat protein
MKKITNTFMKLYITLILLLFVGFSQAQNPQACKYLTKAAESYCAENYSKSIKNLKKLTKKHPNHSLIEEAYYAEGLCYFKKGKYNKAKQAFIYLLENITPKEIDSFGSDIFTCGYMQEKCRNILIPDYLLSIQHEACLKLADISLEENNLSDYYAYVKKADNTFRYWYGCGTGDYEEDMRLSIYYSKYYKAINNLDSSLSEVLPFIFEPAAFPNKYYQDIISQTSSLLLEKYSSDSLKLEFEKSVNAVIQENLSKDNHPSYRYYVLFDEVYIPAGPMYLFEHNANRAEVITFIKNTAFYKAIMD